MVAGLSTSLRRAGSGSAGVASDRDNLDLARRHEAICVTLDSDFHALLAAASLAPTPPPQPFPASGQRVFIKSPRRAGSP